jgi:outer membrane protein assembly factor BamB
MNSERWLHTVQAKVSGYWTHIAMFVVMLVLLLAAIAVPQTTTRAQGGEWSMYLGDVGHSGFNSAETVINPATAPNLRLYWKHKITSKITTQPIAANGMLYWGSWDGIEHGSRLSDGTDVWATNIGQTIDCRNEHLGVLSTAALASISINGVVTPVLFVGGGDSNLYSLNANTGALLWHTPLGFPPNSFLYSSPTVFNGSVYIGVSGNADCQHVQGQVVQVDAVTGSILHTFNVVPTGCTGGSVWTSPTIDAATGILYFSTGEKGHCSQPEKMTVALVALRSADLSFIASWRVPSTQLIPDGDFGASPTLFEATINGVHHNMVGLANKSGIYYAFNRKKIGAGPLWQVRLGTAPGPSMSSSAWDGTNLYVVAGNSIVNGVTCVGSLSALDPATGTALWEDCLNYVARGPVTSVPGLVEVPLGTSILIFDTSTGNQLFNYVDAHGNSNFLGPGSISNGVLYQGNTDGLLYAFGP